jgi:diguanylate cyclase (GGDEF)-like protein
VVFEQQDAIIERFMEKYFFVNKDLSHKRKRLFKKIFSRILIDFLQNDEKVLTRDFTRLANIGLSTNLPYVVLINEVEYIKNIVLTIFLQNGHARESLLLCSHHQNFENLIARIYLADYIKRLVKKNNVRILSLKEMIEKNIVKFYEAHLVWLNSLIRSIEQLDKELVPETDPTCCVFGQWLKSEGMQVIQNDTKYRELSKLHEKLHYIAQKIASILRSNEPIDYHIFMSYLEKAELISLDIGTELALIDHSIFIKQSQKDKLTGTLSRNTLDDIFIHQYELALATEKNFVLAMSDLDDFKTVNDTYGHLAGDGILKAFAKIAMDVLRASDVVVRYGGEEFIFILPAVEYEKGKMILERIRREFESYEFHIGELSVNATVSFGVIEIKPPSDIKYADIDIENYIKAVDDKLYLAKRSGKNTIK